VGKAQERKIWWEGLNGYRNKFRVPDAKHHKSVTGSWKKSAAQNFLRKKYWKLLEMPFFIPPYTF
jgi:hypothetical protein